MRFIMKKIHLKIWTREDDDCVIAWCPTLDVMSQGPNIDTAIANLQEAVNLFVESCQRRGVLEQVLKNAGIDIKDNDSDLKSFGNYYLPVNFNLQQQICHA